MTYHAIGLMSGSSLDGLDIAFVRLEEEGGQWRFEWLATECMQYSTEWLDKLKSAQLQSVPDFLRLHTAYGHYVGESVNTFLAKHGPEQDVDFVASHGHTVFHDPANHTTFQLGDGAAIAAKTGVPVISDLRNMDVALGGQGAPIVPIGDRLLFGEYEYLLNLGGIANISIQSRVLAFDICPCNQLLNYYALREGQPYDHEGKLARAGKANDALVEELRGRPYYQQEAPKSLSNDFSIQQILPLIDAVKLDPKDSLATSVSHVADIIAAALNEYGDSAKPSKLLVTGGGTFNSFLMEQLSEAISPANIEVVVPDIQLIQYKEALVMALIGALRWRNEANVYATVTGAKRDSIGGAIWAGNP